MADGILNGHPENDDRRYGRRADDWPRLADGRPFDHEFDLDDEDLLPVAEPVDLIDLTEVVAPEPRAVDAVEDLLDDAIEMVLATRPLPMSTMVKVPRDELLDLLEAARDELPEELRSARWLLKEREEFLARARQESEDLINEGRLQVARMVERQEIMRAAEVRARQIVEDAKAEAREIERQTEDYCDQKLASFEEVLDKTLSTVKQGRQRLAMVDASQRDDFDLGSRHTDESEY